MDWRRALPILGLGIVSYLLVLQWSEFDTTQRSQELTPATEQSSQDMPPLEEAPDPETTTELSSEAESALPEFQSADDESAQQPGESVPQLDATGDTASTIVVETDTVRAEIQLQTGDLTEVALLQYAVSSDNPTPMRILEQHSGRTYIAQSGLLNQDNRDITRQGRFVAEQDRFELGAGEDELRVPLTQVLDSGLEITKTYVFKRDDYAIDVEFEVRNTADSAQQFSQFGQLRRDRSSDPSRGAGFAMASYLGVATTSEDDRYDKISFRNMDRRAHTHTHFGGWMAFLQHYFVSAWVPPQNETHRYFARENNGLYYAGFTSPARTVEAGGTQTWETTLFVGPKLQDRLSELAEHLQLTVDYGWLWWAAQPLFQLMTFIHDYVGNWGWTIVLLTLIIKMAFYPLSAKAYRSMAKMRKFAPKMQQLKEQYGDDRQKMAQETMKLYKKEKINPMGGCLPMLVQMPVFIALYWVFMESVELRHSPFIFWIQDLSSRDPYFILPLIFGATMFLQMKLGAQPTDPMQAKVMKFLPIGFTAFFLLFPAGLVLYWVVNNSISIAQQQFVNWRVLREDEKAAAAAKADGD
ncbi:membrane protein insertase YidC [Natronospirillum operosum]|uniref:Membrane protein insertase YidC n=1 Tax=Natronospirillum operosum TaxID=2759953 RepID=A0A4Z0W8S1_9GAMM|nr:membrane protein insertase YidC [Natronospirillum operosum]TGG91508.1 membrane protein insertase YidC [Natronospirillum operosum]